MSNTYFWLAMPAVVMLFGGVLTSFWHPHKNLISLIQHFAVGIILAVLMIEVFPAMNEAHPNPYVLITSFSVGVLFMYGIKLLGEHLEKPSSSKAGLTTLNYGLIMTVFIDAILDGTTIGAGFAAGEKVGFSLALGLSVEMLFLGMSLVSDTIKGARVIWISVGLSLTILASALLGYNLLAGASEELISTVLAFSAAALVYLVTEELLIEAHHPETEEKAYSTLILFLGFIMFWLISLTS
jgi:ZIP family zinc transporter